MPIVDEKISWKAASARLREVRKNSTHKENARQIVQKHGSRKSGLLHTVRRKGKRSPGQTEVPL